jgi:hypothetical protein
MSRLLLLGTALVALADCATYTSDFDRARAHYEANEFDKALVLLEVLEHDIDSLSEQERAQYAYFRGMSHLRLEQPKDARHWLANAAARESASQGALLGDAKSRIATELRPLNAPYYGESAAEEDTKASSCKADLDCGDGGYCDAGRCAGAGSSGKASPKKPPEPSDAAGDEGAPKKPSGSMKMPSQRKAPRGDDE